MKRRHFLSYSLLFMAGCSATTRNRNPTSATLNIDKLRLTVTDVPEPERLLRDYETFRQELEAVLGIPVEFVPVNNQIEAASALRLNQVDMALAGPSEYVVINARTNARPLIGITRPNYYSVIATKTGQNIESLEDLKGKTIALSDVGSTSGHLGPTKLLIDAGLDPQTDVKQLMLGDEGNIEAIATGAVAAWGGSAVDYSTFLNSEEEFPIIAETPPLPSDIFMVNSQLDSRTVAALRDRMVENQERLIAALVEGESTQKYKGSELFEAQDSDYDLIRQVYEAIGEGELIEN
ncbi:MAG: phosphate/phosphite/phosphonate ABC transporter substrate-binding protein [Limnospira sp.]